MNITDQDTSKVADLIKIKIPGSDLAKYTDQLAHALDPAAKLQELNTDSVEVLSHPTGLTTQGAADEVQPGLSTDLALANAVGTGRAALNYIKVPKVN